jgi:hypothetical protein
MEKIGYSIEMDFFFMSSCSVDRYQKQKYPYCHIALGRLLALRNTCLELQG